MGKLKNILLLFAICILIGICIYFCNILIKDFRTFEIANIELVEFLENEQKIKVKVTKNDGFYHKTFSCVAIDKASNEIITSNGDNNTCIIDIPIEKDFSIFLKDGNFKSIEYNLLDYLDNKLSFQFENDIIYMLVGAELEIQYSEKNISKNSSNYQFLSKDESILKIENNKMIGISAGSTVVYAYGTTKELKVVVTDLITEPIISGTQKKSLPCGIYSEEDNNILDKLLELEINEAGYGTRAGAVAAARFLTLEFPYKVPYFYENGRLHKSGVNYVDGEGRYYHKGLYLNKIKYKDIIAKFSGPVIWGCPLNNWEDAPEYNYVYGEKKPNGLDCSGFVAWVLYNGGFDPGDIGAGESNYPYQMTDLGKYTKITKDVLNSDVIKVGDLFNYWGHIAIIIGMDETHFYVAESLPNFGGVVAKTYNKNTVANTFTHVVLMDEFYKNDGNYTEMWN